MEISLNRLIKLALCAVEENLFPKFDLVFTKTKIISLYISTKGDVFYIALFYFLDKKIYICYIIVSK